MPNLGLSWLIGCPAVSQSPWIKRIYGRTGVSPHYETFRDCARDTNSVKANAGKNRCKSGMDIWGFLLMVAR